MPHYARETTVSVQRTRGEIEQVLERYGATGFMYAWQNNAAAIIFEMHQRRIRFILPLPNRDSREFWYTPSRGTRRSDAQAREAWEQSCRQRWRALALVIKAKLEAIETQITTFEDEFLAHTLLPNGSTVGEWIQPQLEETYRDGRMPPLLPGPSPEK
ncbi:hypothetical protein [Herpetosiphon sp. NSE202]|uniref:hypothetical protein n=1 Tax=Herpetosiphon sp. NSE202 TaxID=3351349 RepID=UPI00363343F1